MSEQPHIDSSTQGISKKLAALGLVITLSGGLLTWHASYLNSQQAIEQSCIARLDEREMLLRKKGEALLASIGEFGGSVTNPTYTVAEYRSGGTDIIVNAMRLIAYAPPELGKSALNIMATMQYGLMARTLDEQERAIQLAATAMKGWPSEFYSLMQDFEQRRKNCREYNYNFGIF